MRLLKTILLIATFVSIVAACTHMPDYDDQKNQTDSVEQDAPTAENTISFTGDAIAEGELIYSFSNARLISYEEDIPDVSKIEANFYIPMDGDSDYHYPDFINVDGSFVKGIYLLMIDVSVENRGARQYTKYDINEFGDPRGLYEDPYVFEPWIFLVDTSRYTDDSCVGYYYNTIHYFSEMNVRDEHRLAFRLEPGETISFTIGFFVSDIDDGGWFSFDNLYLSDSSGDKNGNLVPLNLQAIGYENEND